MAFALLSDEELLLLTENQKEQYEKELTIYRKRAAFVERLERYEKVKIKPFRPDKPNIAIGKPICVCAYKQPEYAARLRKIDLKKAPEIHFGKAYVLKNIGVPEIGVKAAACRPFRYEKHRKFNLPEVKTVNLKMKAYCIPESMARKAPANVNMVKVPEAPAVGRKIDVSALTVFELPTVKSVSIMKKKDFKPDISPLKVPAVSVSHLETHTLSDIRIAKNSINDIPNIEVVDLSIPEVRVEVPDRVDLPSIETKIVPIFKEKEIRTPDLGAFAGNQVRIKSIKAPHIVRQKTMGTNIEKVKVKVPSLALKKTGKIKINKRTVQTPRINGIKIKPFFAPKNIRPDIPRLSVAVVDIQSEMKGFTKQRENAQK